ncbi:MAG: hypothetical protein A3F17_00195 [Gammaproteobacteria bacterium RIFCSPHIGHO2_12_FULL_41_15]|nr:MAG: hypothetical protein A3F17_00195 [Gammaproteobacteria bacterium RIFCSPHIGHO2_12_FULL_41_15]
MKKLPIGYSSLINMRQENCLYIDKSAFVKMLALKGKYYFLSRPRRFGKSVLIDTLHQAFIGNRTAFKDLYLENHWDWSIQYPVIRFGFSGVGGANSAELLDGMIRSILNDHAEQHDIEIPKEASHGLILEALIKKLFAKYKNQVVVLVDEYDKPILDVIEDEEKAIANREVLKNLYGTLKELDQYLKFVFLTGVSKFSKVSLFSGLNNLQDITLTPTYADICGYTQQDIETEFKDHLHSVDKQQLKKWYNGYNFSGTETQKVYNPFDILLFISNHFEYRSYWFETGSPSFLIKLLEKNRFYMPDFESLSLPESSLGDIDIHHIPFAVLAFQTGYFTIKDKTIDPSGRVWYTLSYPNQEVKISLTEQIAKLAVGPVEYSHHVQSIYKALSLLDFDQLKETIQSFFSSIPNDWYRNNDIAHYEGFYCSLVYSYFCAAAYEVIGEDVTNKGRIDLTIKAPNAIFIFEFKMKKDQDSAMGALSQIKNKKYADKYRCFKKPIYLIGMLFDAEEKNLMDFVWESFP